MGEPRAPKEPATTDAPGGPESGLDGLAIVPGVAEGLVELRTAVTDGGVPANPTEAWSILGFNSGYREATARRMSWLEPGAAWAAAVAIS